uniref:Wadjet protein JetD C-terminal domain-containing protein n=1 Tax=Geobacter sp. (strain M21) TaxID=443144 RepID=C6E1B8_GEOSM
MNQPSRELLTKLLHAWQGNPKGARKVSLSITKARAAAYFQAVLPEEKGALHAGLEEAAASGAIALEWGKGFESHILRRVVLVDGAVLAEYLGVPLASQQADQARSALESCLEERESWIDRWVAELLDHWSRNQGFNGIAPGEVATATLLVRALSAVAAGRQRNLDLRTFSTRELGNSKAMESILAKFASIWKKHHAADYPAELTNEELFEAIGLVKFPQPLLLRGPLTLRLAGRDVDCEGIEPFVGLPPQAMLDVLADQRPEYCLTIENLASFNRYTTEVRDRGVIVFTSGFPSPGVADFLRLLDRALPAAIPFFHWGDIDEGGLKIFLYLQGLVKRGVQPHRMTPELLTAKGQPSPGLRRREVGRLIADDRTVALLAEAILSTAPARILEQENIDPVAPSVA